MDPITGAVVAIVIWLFLMGIGPTLITWASGAVGAVFGKEEGMVLGVFVGWFLAAGWALFALIQAILQIVHLIQLIIGA